VAQTLREKIKEITREHLTKNKGLLLGQSVRGVGWVADTVPDCEGIQELSNADVSGAGIAVGVALAQRRPILILRYQDYVYLVLSPLINMAGKCREIFNIEAPIFIRALADDSKGPGHSAKLHQLFMHSPGFRVWAPITPNEYELAWEDFMSHPDPMFVSEHRQSFENSREFSDKISGQALITLYGISITRFAMEEAAERLRT